ncbi:hypothetical protein LT493_06420 [Streptomyces tricolor]|nr:hypothetical protein [Streptomyces tricolor]
MNSNEYGLRNSLWTRDQEVVDRFVAHTVTGGLLKVNDSHIAFTAPLPSARRHRSDRRGLRRGQLPRAAHDSPPGSLRRHQGGGQRCSRSMRPARSVRRICPACCRSCPESPLADLEKPDNQGLELFRSAGGRPWSSPRRTRGSARTRWTPCG